MVDKCHIESNRENEDPFKSLRLYMIADLRHWSSVHVFKNLQFEQRESYQILKLMIGLNFFSM